MTSASQKSESPELAAQGFQKQTEEVTKKSFSQPTAGVNRHAEEPIRSDTFSSAQTASDALSARFLALLETHVSRLTIRGRKVTGLCPLHPDRSPSFSANLEKLVWYCFPCGKGGGVKDFALAVGEPWSTIRHNPRERARVAVQARRRQADEQARAILQQRKDERDNTLWAAWFDANAEANSALELLALFFRRPDLVDEFSELVARAEREYGEAVSKRVVLEAQLGGEVEVVP